MSKPLKFRYERGSLAILGDAVLVAVHKNYTSPYAALLSNPIGIPPGQGVAIGVKESQIDRREVRNAGVINSYISGDIGESCVLEDEDPISQLALEMGLKGWSKANCNLFFMSSMYRKCNLMSLWAMKGARGDDLKFDFSQDPDLELFKEIPYEDCTPNLILKSLEVIAWNETLQDYVLETLIQRISSSLRKI